MIKTNQKILSKKYCEDLINALEKNNLRLYLSEKPFIDITKTPRGKSNIYINKDISLKIPQSKNEHFDFENAVTIFREFSSLNPTQASDIRLWTFLTHFTFWDYMRKRWPLERFEDDSNLFDEIDLEERDIKAEDITAKKIRFIKWRYHLTTPSRRRLLRNGISRLWWYVYMTKQENEADPYYLTKIMLEYQDVAQNLLERSLGSDTKILKSFLLFLKDNEDLSRDDIRSLIKEINLIGGVQNLHSLGITGLKKNINSIAQKVL